jgi:two-component system, OmpR family, sensor histidine kinase SenX3
MSPLRRDPPTNESDDESARAAAGEAAERERLARVLDALHTGVVVVDGNGEEVFRNPAAEQYRDPRHVDAVVANAMQELLAQARSGAACERQLQVFGPPRAALHLRALPVAVGSSGVGAAVFVDDVSESHRVESVRRDFVANVSHELKTPIGALEVLAETLSMETDPAVTRPLAERMVREAERLGRIVDDLLDLSLIETQESPTRDPVPFGLLMEEAVDRVRPAAASAGIELVVDDDTDGAIVPCDRRQLSSAIVNLLDNAVKYSEPRSRVEVRATRAADRVVLVVRDHGIGIPSRDLERIFERFYRVDQARSRSTGGTGLGLAIVRHVVSAHGGEVTVESVEGVGSTFRVALPTRAEHALSVQHREAS